MKYSEFLKILNESGESDESAFRRVFLENRDTIRIKKEKTAVKNLEKILDAVFEITYEKGFSAMTMRYLSQKSGLSLGALYPYFKSKEELLSIILRQGLSMVTRVLESFADRHEDPVLKLDAVIKAHIFLSEKARPWFYFMFMEAKNLNPPEWQTVMEAEFHTEKVIVDILKAGEDMKSFKKQDHLLTASIIKAMQQEWYLKRWKYSRRNITVDDYVEYVLGFVRAFCLAESA